jgi:hypothetical protein
MVSFSCLSVLAWHDHMKVISHVSYTNIFNFDIDRDRKLVLDTHETRENKHKTARLLGQEGNRHHSLWCPSAINIARINLLMKTSYGNVFRYTLFMHDCAYNKFLTLLDFVWLLYFAAIASCEKSVSRRENCRNINFAFVRCDCKSKRLIYSSRAYSSKHWGKYVKSIYSEIYNCATKSIVYPYTISILIP